MAKSKRSRKNAGQIHNIVVVSDIHAGCRLGLCPAEGVELDDGGLYLPSRLQKIVWGYWKFFWGQWVPRVTHGEPYAVVVNGDLVNGKPHDAVTNISDNPSDQENIAYKILKPIRDQCEGRFYVIRGTETHVAKSASDEERLARRLEAVPNQDGQHARWELNKKIGPYVCNFLHHIGTTASSAHETSAINAELTAAFVEAGRWGHRPPEVLVRSHRHRNGEVRIPAKWGYATAFVTAGWQLKTPFAYKIAGGRMTTPQMGGSLIRLGDEELHSRHRTWGIERDPPE